MHITPHLQKSVRDRFFRSVRDRCRSGSLRNLDEALGLFDRMLHIHPLPSLMDFTQLLTAIARTKHHSTVITLIKEMQLPGITPDGLYLQGNIAEVVKLVNKIKKIGYKPNIVTYGMIMNGLCKISKTSDAIGLLRKMDEGNLELNIVLYNTIIDSLCKDRLRNSARHLHLQFFNSRPMHRMDEAVKAFNTIVEKDCSPSIVSYNILIHGCCKARRIDETMILFREMSTNENFPNVVTYNTLMDGLCKNLHFQEAMALFHEMEDRKLDLDIVIYNILIDGMCNVGKLTTVRELFNTLHTKGLQANIQTCNIMIKGLCKEGLLKEARVLFEQMDDNSCSPNHVTYNTIIQGFLKHNKTSWVVKYMKMMVDKVIRNVGGSVAAARAKFLSYIIDPTTAEAMAAWYAASLGKEVGGVSIILEGDSLEVVSALRKEGFCNWVFGPLLDDIKACFSNFLIVDVMHVRREMLIKQLMIWLNVQFLKC
ncbi:pentatricopeptide repeat-containing protein At1g12300, mitochondrial-like [Alnus glutinosa]|uniref:pentatricopeptide repeat-containing protein At1g12300, mitochondrial-like n=1 Tax=Alnus glutinosa TaxID=3517 RepID=UPI002D77AC58|nr:pentatricopeptide repeat-containing protein At1g12300, mitochondrial-like [Alnus glutinosa]